MNSIKHVSYEVIMSDSTENTGLDGSYFSSREEAQKAADAVNEMYTNARAEVFGSNRESNMTFLEWDALGW